MASRKSKRYGQGGSKHKHTPNPERPNGKAWKRHPKAFDLTLGRLHSAAQALKGTSHT
jgi:hypothetical protein